MLHHTRYVFYNLEARMHDIVISNLSHSYIIVRKLFPFQHYLPYDEPAHLTIEAIQIFLDDILAGTAPVYGGSSYSVR